MSKVSKTLDEIEPRKRAKAKAEALFARPIIAPRHRVLLIEADEHFKRLTPERDQSADELALVMLRRNAARVEHDVNDKVCRAIAAGAVMSPGLHHQKSPEARSLHQPVKRHFTYKTKRYPPWSSK